MAARATCRCVLRATAASKSRVRSRAVAELQWRQKSSAAAGLEVEEQPAISAAAPAPAPLSDYLNRVLNARVYDVAVETPLQPALNLSNMLQNSILLKVSPCCFYLVSARAH